METWPAFTATVNRAEFDSTGTHTTYYQHPLYYFVNDMAPGDVNGDDVKDVWHLVYPNTAFVEHDEVKCSDIPRR